MHRPLATIQPKGGLPWQPIPLVCCCVRVTRSQLPESRYFQNNCWLITSLLIKSQGDSSMGKIVRCCLVALSVSAGGCASIVKGTEQQVMINTVPQGAKCTLNREGALLATIPKTPQTTTLSKSWNDVHIACRKPGFRKTTGVLNAQTEAMTSGNLLIGGLVGVAIDAGTGAMNTYDGTITIPLVPKERRAPAKQQHRRKPEKPIS